ncbi:3-ketoacyl-coa synthase [Trifolium repens]|nr:3-ketoacyl-coa synthase [Trifolium repens]
MSLDLSEYDLQPARTTLHRFGNTSAIVCCLLEVMKDVNGYGNVWEDAIDDYPPKSLSNVFMEKYDWLNEVEDPNNYKLPGLDDINLHHFPTNISEFTMTELAENVKEVSSEPF